MTSLPRRRSSRETRKDDGRLYRLVTRIAWVVDAFEEESGGWCRDPRWNGRRLHQESRRLGGRQGPPPHFHQHPHQPPDHLPEKVGPFKVHEDEIAVLMHVE